MLHTNSNDIFDGHALTDLLDIPSQSTFFVVFPTKFAILYTFANICALARRVLRLVGLNDILCTPA